MPLRITWSSRGGLRLAGSKRIGRLSLWESVPLNPLRAGRRRRRTRKGASFRL